MPTQTKTIGLTGLTMGLLTYLGSVATSRPLISGEVVFDPNDDVELTGGIRTRVHASSNDPTCTPSEKVDEDTSEIIPPPQVCNWGSTGGSCGWVALEGSGAKFSCTTHASGGSSSYDVAFGGSGSRNLIEVNYGAVGSMWGRAVDSTPPCGGGGLDLTHASISCYAGTIPGDTLEIIIPFTVTVTSQAVLEVGVSTLVESMAIDSSVTCQWIVGLPNCGEDANGSITATEDDPAEVDARLCCVTPGDYTLTVRVTATHTISGGDDCDAGSFYVAGDIEDAVMLSLSFEEDACLE